MHFSSVILPAKLTCLWFETHTSILLIKKFLGSDLQYQDAVDDLFSKLFPMVSDMRERKNPPRFFFCAVDFLKGAVSTMSDYH